MYMIVYEDLNVEYTDSMDDDLIEAADYGYLSIIDIDQDPPKEYYNGEWHELELYERSKQA